MMQPAPTTVRGTVRGSVTTVTVSGRITWSNLAIFQQDLRHQTGRTPDVVVDLGDLDSWSVTAQALFIVAVHHARARGTAIAVVNLKDRAWLQLERSGLAAELYRALWGARRPQPSTNPVMQRSAHAV